MAGGGGDLQWRHNPVWTIREGLTEAVGSNGVRPRRDVSEWAARKRKGFRPITELWFRARGEDSVFLSILVRLLEKPSHFGSHVTKVHELDIRQLSQLLHEALIFSSVGNSIMWAWLWTLLLGGWAAPEKHGGYQVGLTSLCRVAPQRGSQKSLVGVWVVSVVLPNEGKGRIFFIQRLFLGFR